MGGVGGLALGLRKGIWVVGVVGGEVGESAGVGGRGSLGCLVPGEIGPRPDTRRRNGWPPLVAAGLTGVVTGEVAVLTAPCFWPHTNKNHIRSAGCASAVRRLKNGITGPHNYSALILANTTYILLYVLSGL